jgi:ABC-2 type transport system ATP-binding protein
MTFVQAININKTIKNHIILKNINLSVDKGTVCGIRGHNGSGKTMLLRIIAGLITPTSGTILVDGKQVGKDIPFPKNLGILIEYPGFIPDYSGYKNLYFLSMLQNKIGEAEIRQTLSQVGLNPNDPRKFKKYSLGMKQRLGIAQAIMENPDLLLLDEPTNALDDKGIAMVSELIHNLKKQGKTIILTSHDKEFLNEVSDQIHTISEGEFVRE